MNTQLRDRSQALAGVGFGSLTIIGLVMLWSVPDQKGPTEEWVAHLADSGDRTTLFAGALLVAVAVLAFGWWLTGLAQRLDGLQPPHRRGAALATGAVVAGLLLVAATTMFAVSGTVGIGEAPTPSGELGLHLWYLGFWLLLLPVGISGAFFLAMTASAGAHELPRWLCVAAWIAALLQLTATFWVITVLALPVWVLLAGIVMLRPTEDLATLRSTAAKTTAMS